MGVNSSYDLRIISAPDNFDQEYFCFKLMTCSPAAKRFIDESGKSIGNEGNWSSLEDDVTEMSKSFPEVFFALEEHWQYEDSGDIRHYFKNGNYAEIEPEVVKTWPEPPDWVD